MFDGWMDEWIENQINRQKKLERDYLLVSLYVHRVDKTNLNMDISRRSMLESCRHDIVESDFRRNALTQSQCQLHYFMERNFRT